VLKEEHELLKKAIRFASDRKGDLRIIEVNRQSTTYVMCGCMELQEPVLRLALGERSERERRTRRWPRRSSGSHRERGPMAATVYQALRQRALRGKHRSHASCAGMHQARVHDPLHEPWPAALLRSIPNQQLDLDRAADRSG